MNIGFACKAVDEIIDILYNTNILKKGSSKMKAKINQIVDTILDYINQEDMELDVATDMATNGWHMFDNFAEDKQVKLYDKIENEVLKGIR